MKKYIFIALFFTVFTQAFAAVEKYSERIEGTEISLPIISTVPIFTVVDAKYINMASGSWTTEFSNYKVSNTVRLGINPDIAQTNDLIGGVNVRIKMWKWNASTNSFTTSFVNQVLSLNYVSGSLNLSSTASYDEMSTYQFADAHKVEVYITSINGGANFDKNDFFISSEIEVERYYKMPATSNVLVDCQTDPTNANYYRFTWPSNDWAEYYELEWVHISDVNAQGPLGAATFTPAFNYYLNSTRIAVKGNSYSIPKIFDSGYLFYRIRGIGKLGATFSVIKEGAWSSPESGAFTSHTVANRFYIATEYDAQMNWSHQVSYGDNGERFEAVSFSDGLGRERQGVTHNTETKQAVVSNVYYDELGRPVISDLPTPVNGEVLQHYPNFNKENSSNTAFKADNFNLQSGCDVVGSEFSSSSGAGKYYSFSNGNLNGNNAFIPDAEKYPYTRVQYINDFTGRMLKVSGAGKTLGTGGGHETSFDYATVNQAEIDKIFGLEAGNASHYQKMITTDANGQSYVQYTDMAGRVVASALTGNEPTSVDKIEGNNPVTTVVSILPQNLQNVVTDPIPTATLSYIHFVEAANNYTFDYSFTPQQFSNLCMQNAICFDCKYDLNITIISEKCDTIVFDSTMVLIGKDLTNPEIDNCVPNSFGGLHTLPIPLAKGSYQIVKTLTVNQQAIDDKWCTYIEQTSCDGSISTKFNELYSLNTFSACDPEVDLPEAESINDCDFYKEMLLKDLVFGGQYAQCTIGNSITGSTYTPFSTTLNPYVHSVLSNSTASNLGVGRDWRNPVGDYKNSDNTKAFVLYNGVQTEPEFLPFQIFVENFKQNPSWAEALITYHPEYCFYDFCVQNSLSTDRDSAMLATYEFKKAWDDGYFKAIATTPASAYGFSPYNVYTNQLPADVLYYDPFFASGGKGATLASAMNSEMMNYLGSGQTMWQQAIASGPYNGGYQCDFDAIWVAFRKMYLELKAEKVYQMMKTTCNNSHIGFGNWANKVSIFGNIAIFNSLDPDGAGPLSPINLDTDGSSNSTDTGVPVNQAFIDAQIAANCTSSCNEYALEWIAKMSECEQYSTLPQAVKDNFKTALVTVCKGGCNSETPTGSVTSPTAFTVQVTATTTAVVSSIDNVMLAFFGNGYEDNFCTSLLISEPGVYQSKNNQINQVSKPLDNCACDLIMRANSYLPSAGNNPNNYNLEEMIASLSGITLEDANQLLCACERQFSYKPEGVLPNVSLTISNTNLAGMSIRVPAELTCSTGSGCVDASIVNGHITALKARFSGLESLSNYESILTNYLNNKLFFHLNFQDYQTFIAKYNATAAAPYCEINPLLNEYAKVLNLLTFRGQLLNTSVNPVNLLGKDPITNVATNIVYANGALKDVILHDNYWSVQSSDATNNILTSYIGNSTLNKTFTLSILKTKPFSFSDIISFGIVEPLTNTSCSNNFTFKVYVSYLDCGEVKYDWITGTNNCFQANLCICSNQGLTLCDVAPSIEVKECYQPQLDQLYSNALESYLNGLDQLYSAFKQQFNAKCATAFNTETFTVTGKTNSYQYTLYFYDQAGNLVKTVAPNGNNPALFNTANVSVARAAFVNSSTLASYNPPVYPKFDYETTYQYNSYNQLVSTTNPDQEGDTKFIYDYYGRIIASQNPVQKDAKLYSYSLYDPYGRPVEVGQAGYNGTTVLDLAGNPNIKLNDKGVWFKAWVYSCSRSEVTFTLYDKSLAGSTIPSKFANAKQENLRLRVASVFYFKTVSGATMPITGYESAIHYSYDLHGNVIEQLQDVPQLSPVLQDIKSTQYSFELISGNMKTVEFQKGKRDRMTHYYSYDKLYRLSEVFTSTDGGIHKSREAHYRYYDYGPLARIELGQNKVQGQDFTYTINGWIKGMNSSTLNVARDGGKDGTSGYTGLNNSRLNELVAKDAVGYTLGYFKGDYKSIGTSSFEADLSSAVNPYGSAIFDLYNGNISHSETGIEGFEVLGSAFKYDQLQQLKSMKVFRSTSLNATNSWAAAVATTDYNSDYKYDRNGNLTHLNRNASTSNGLNGLNMDKFIYSYTTVPTIPTGTKLSNRLNKVTDGPDATTNVTPSISDDIEPGQLANNYTYDKIGQLKSDVQAGITLIEWRNGDKKILSQTSQTRRLEFVYNPFGQRVLKIEKACVAGVPQAQTSTAPWNYTYYAYDANGQVMSTYAVVINTGNITAHLDEQNIYGAGRIGLIESGKALYLNNLALPVEGPIWVNVVGKKRFELTNHLGNVNAVISDRKRPLVNTYAYVSNTFNAPSSAPSTEGWTVTAPATITQSNGQINIVTNLANNFTSKTFATVAGEEYDVIIHADRGASASQIALYIGSTTTTINSGQNTTVTFTATGPTTLIKVGTVLAPTANYSFFIRDITVASHAKYSAVVIMKADYYPFGMQMPGRFTNSGDYRYGYNGMEKDKEIKGDGNSYTTEFRQYDPRLGRWLSLDPLMAMFPDMSPYVAFDNNPIYYNDPLGLAPEGGDGDPPGTGKGEEDWGGSSSSKPVDITAEKSCASEDYKNWYKERGGSEFWHGVSNEIYNRKVKACQNGLARMRWGTDEFGDARIPQELKDKKRAEAEAETKDAIHAAYATDKSGVDPTSMKYTFNPFARTAWLRARALAVSSRDEGMSLLSGVAFDCAVSWLSSRGLMKGPNFKMGRKFGRAAYRTEVKGLQNTVNEMRLAKCSSEEIARKVHQMRRDIGLKYKNLSNPDLLEKIYKRNIDKYGDKLGPTIEFLIEKGKSWDDIIESAIRPGGKDLGL